MSAIESRDHLYELRAEAIEAGNQRCPECREVGNGERLFVFATVRGNKARVHDGAFCSQQCHDIWHGLVPKRDCHQTERTKRD
jgi:hypothetical protein